MSIDKQGGSVEAIRRKLRAITAIVKDSGATEHEKANAAALKTRMERRLRDAGAPAGDWTDEIFRLGRLAGGIAKSISPTSSNSDLTSSAHQLGKALRRGYKKWVS
ncbi:MAG TPA: hypothetical protein VGR45_04965 [Stellaceae bacterium]|nr:hypothetical protein [Stellaceae bacterium]